MDAFRQLITFALGDSYRYGDPDKARDEAHKSLTHPAGLLEEAYEVVAVSTAGTGYSNPLGEINKAWGEVL